MSVSHKDLPLRKKWLNHRAKERLGSGAGIVRGWPTEDAPSRSAVWRWMNSESANGIPPNQVLAFAGALDVDPFALFEFTPDLYAKLCSEIARRIAFAKSIGLLFKQFAWAHDVIAPDETWPPEDLASRYFNRWTVHDFRHTPKQGEQPFFQQLKVTAENGKFAEPQVWHFAFQTLGRHPVWRPYGFVKREDCRIELRDFQGRTDGAEAPDPAFFIVETCFGLGPVKFRVASLHPFGLTLVPPSAGLGSVRCVRFS
jgi:hypothetical protein